MNQNIPKWLLLSYLSNISCLFLVRVLAYIVSYLAGKEPSFIGIVEEFPIILIGGGIITSICFIPVILVIFKSRR